MRQCKNWRHKSQLKKGGDIMLSAQLENCDAYHISEINKSDKAQLDQYLRILAETYTPLGFFRQSVIPKEETICFGIWHEGAMEGIFGLTPIRSGDQTVFRNLIDDVRSVADVQLIEISNVVLRKKIRGDVALGVMLYEAAQRAHAKGFHFLVGITRYQTLRYFVNFGVTPVLHEPLHLMGMSSVDDYVIYFDTHSKDSVVYMHERAKRYFRQESIMARIKGRYAQQKNVLPQIATEEPSDVPS
jgi:hypothetical protein